MNQRKDGDPEGRAWAAGTAKSPEDAPETERRSAEPADRSERRMTADQQRRLRDLCQRSGTRSFRSASRPRRPGPASPSWSASCADPTMRSALRSAVDALPVQEQGRDVRHFPVRHFGAPATSGKERGFTGRGTASSRGCGCGRPAGGSAAIVYQIYPRSFQDSNGDGVGDLPGITRSGSTTCAWLGVDAIWISPIYPSPMADFGYDVSDYCDIHPLFGTLADFDALLAEAHAARAQGHPRLRAEPHLGPAPLVPGIAAPRATTRSATGTSGATRRRTAARRTTG